MPSFLLRIKLTFCQKPICFFALSSMLAVLIVAIGFFAFFKHYENKFYPGIFVENHNLEGMTRAQAKTLLQKSSQPQPHSIILTMEDIKISSTSAQLETLYLHEKTLNEAYEIGRRGNFFSRSVTSISLLNKPVHLKSTPTYNRSLIEQMVLELKKQVDLPGKEPSAELKISGSPSSIVIEPGTPGRILDVDKTTNQTYQILISRLESEPDEYFEEIIEAVVASTSASLSPEEIQQAQIRAQKFVGHKAKLSGEYQSLFLSDQEMVGLLNMPTGINEAKLNELLEKWNQAITRPHQNAEFEYDKTTLKVSKFVPPLNGLQLDKNKTKQDLLKLFAEIENDAAAQQATQTATVATIVNKDHQLELTLAVKPPDITLEKTNDLGIKEMIGFGESYYPHSIPNRIHNVAITTERINLIIVKPGEEFSFNKTVGEVSSKTGYKAAYVIRNGRTELGDGGGVCQVSSTLFRTLLDSGLEITKRKPHSYRVSYYEENNRPGFDATVYAGDVDLRFVNDTGHHVLIYAQADSANVYMKVEIYGTSDGRTTEIVDYKQWGYSSPPAPVFIPDSTIPKGSKRQVDWSASGLNVSFKHLVKDKDGNLIRENTYVSNYKPWSAKYLVGI